MVGGRAFVLWNGMARGFLYFSTGAGGRFAFYCSGFPSFLITILRKSLDKGTGMAGFCAWLGVLFFVVHIPACFRFDFIGFLADR